MADEQVSLTVLQWVGGLLVQVAVSVGAAIKGVMLMLAKREADLGKRMDGMEEDIAANTTAVAVLHAQGNRMEKLLDDINRKQDRQMEILLQQRRD